MTIADTMHDTAETIKESAEGYEVRSFDPFGHKAITLLAEDMKLLMRYLDSSSPIGEETEHRKKLTEQIKTRFGIKWVETQG